MDTAGTCRMLRQEKQLSPRFTRKAWCKGTLYLTVARHLDSLHSSTASDTHSHHKVSRKARCADSLCPAPYGCVFGSENYLLNACKCKVYECS